ASVSLFIPQFSFISAVTHPEAATRLFAAAVTFVLAARATGHPPRWSALLLLPRAVPVLPIADRQARLIALIAALRRIATEPTRRGRMLAAATLVLPAATAAWIIVYHTELGTNFEWWTDLLRHPLRPFILADPSRGSTPPHVAYYAFEFVPKMFIGFW